MPPLRLKTMPSLNLGMPAYLPLHGFRLIVAIAILAAIQPPAHSEGTGPLESISPQDPAVLSSHRNERSTPPNAVLPSSPAIASQNDHIVDHVSVGLAKAILLRLGYPVGRLDNRITAKFKAALFRYQRAHGILSSGTLDDVTLRSLGIAEK